jgi:hypothetical protein
LHPTDALPCSGRRAAPIGSSGASGGSGAARRPARTAQDRAEQRSWPPRQRAKKPRDIHRGDRSLGKSRTAAYGAMAASAAQPRRALIWINRTGSHRVTPRCRVIARAIGHQRDHRPAVRVAPRSARGTVAWISANTFTGPLFAHADRHGYQGNDRLEIQAM